MNDSQIDESEYTWADEDGGWKEHHTVEVNTRGTHLNCWTKQCIGGEARLLVLCFILVYSLYITAFSTTLLSIRENVHASLEG